MGHTQEHGDVGSWHSTRHDGVEALWGGNTLIFMLSIFFEEIQQLPLGLNYKCVLSQPVFYSFLNTVKLLFLSIMNVNVEDSCQFG